MKFCLLFFCLISFNSSFAQDVNSKISEKELELKALLQKMVSIEDDIEGLKLDRIIVDLKAIGLPSEDYIEHSAMILSYNDHHKQANWVAHIIVPEIMKGTETRTNDFRVDPKVIKGTAVEEDYFSTSTNASGEIQYDGFGFDRGHLAPSADFRWSQKALSESYYYSNISPQVAHFNRETWRSLEDAVRSYLYANQGVQLYVLTAPILNDKLNAIPRSKHNKVSVPQAFVKAIVDVKNKKGIAFYIKNKELYKPINQFSISIDSAENLLQLDLFNKLDDKLESYIEGQLNLEDWFTVIDEEVTASIDASTLNPGEYNALMARQKRLDGKKAKVCGTLVGFRKSRKGNYWANFDAKYPNAPFSFWIRKENIINFSQLPDKYLLNEKVCVEGKINNYGDNVSIEIFNEDDLTNFKSKQ